MASIRCTVDFPATFLRVENCENASFFAIRIFSPNDNALPLTHANLAEIGFHVLPHFSKQSYFEPLIIFSVSGAEKSLCNPL